MRFLQFNTDKKYQKFEIKTFFIAFLKFFSAIYCETILCIMITFIPEINDIIKDFVALGFIVEIDDYFAASLPGTEWDELIEKLNKELII